MRLPANIFTLRLSSFAILLFLSGFVFLFASSSLAEVPKDLKQKTLLRGEMNDVFLYFQKLYPYIVQESRFIDPSNSKKVLELIDGLRTSFNKVGKLKGELRKEPGFASTALSLLKILISFIRKSGKRESPVLRQKPGIHNYLPDPSEAF